MKNYTKILSKIFEKPEYHFHIRELAKETGLNPNTIISVVNQFEKEGIVKREKRKSFVEVYADVESEKYKRKKLLYNIELIYSSGIVDFLTDFYNAPKAIILFGSFLRGEDFSGSDVDIAVISRNDKRPDIEIFERKIKRRIHLLVFDYKEISKEFFSNLINGFVLYGSLEYDKI